MAEGRSCEATALPATSIHANPPERRTTALVAEILARDPRGRHTEGPSTKVGVVVTSVALKGTPHTVVAIWWPMVTHPYSAIGKDTKVLVHFHLNWETKTSPKNKYTYLRKRHITCRRPPFRDVAVLSPKVTVVC